MTAFLLTLTAFAGTNIVTGDLESYYVVPPVLDVSSIAGTGLVAHNWSVPYAAVSATANYGSNHVSFTWSPPTNVVINPYTPFVNVDSKWTDTLVITGGTGTNVAVFQLLIRSSITGSGAVDAGWDFNIGPDLFFTGENFPEGSSSSYRYLNCPFTYDVPFSVRANVAVSVGVADVGQRSGYGELRIDEILLPAGDTISPTGGNNWLTNFTIVHPSLDIAAVGPNLKLNWIMPPNHYLESTTNLSSSSSWSQVNDLLIEQTNQIEYSSPLPLPADYPARFFRLRKNPNY